MTNRKRTFFIHLIIWTCYWGLEFAVASLIRGNHLHYVETIPNAITNTLIFYIVLYVLLPRSNVDLNYWKMALGLSVLLVLYLMLKIIYKYIIDSIGIETNVSFNDLHLLLVGNLYRFILFSVYASFAWYFTSSNRLTKIVLEKELEEERLTNQLLVAQQATLKAQINPHFLFNTLSFIYSRSIPSTDQTVSKTILLLSDVLRYSLNDLNKSQKIVLNKEIEYVKKIKEINSLRYSNDFYFIINSKGEEQQKKIPPFILLTIFENALKHGEYQNKETPIVLSIQQLHDTIEINLVNHKKFKPHSESFGGYSIGNRYIYSILEATYKTNFNLDIKDEAKAYNLYLKISTND